MKVFSFYADGQLFAVDVDRIQKVARKMAVTHVPAAPDAITGIINLKGRVITVFSLCNLLGRKEKRQVNRRKSKTAGSLDEIAAASAAANAAAADVVNIVVFKSFSGMEDQMGLIFDKPGVLINIDDETITLPSLAACAEDNCFFSGIAELDNMLYRIINIDSIIDKYKNIGRNYAENISTGGVNKNED